jgi:hypothetical protein
VRKYVTRVSSFVVLSIALLSAAPLAAQTAPFKIGDSVEVMYAGKWVPGVVTKGLDSGTYVVNNGNFVMYINEGPDNIRPHQMTSSEKTRSDQSAQAFAHRPTGNGIGAQYGAREPVTCKSRKAPPTATTVKQYVYCGMEGMDADSNLVLVTNVSVQMASPRAYLFERDSGKYQIDQHAPVIDIRGGYKIYQCGKPNPVAGAFTATHNCVSYDQPAASGTCYRDTFGDWNCSLVGNRLASNSQVKDQMAPRGY